MRTSAKLLIAVFLIASATAISAFIIPAKKITPQKKAAQSVNTAQPAKQKIQAAILLDVSNSMDGLINQAKEQLWNMVSTMGNVKCGTGEAPEIEIALYEYGRTSNDVTKGYVKQINSFITNLDSLSENLFALSTNGGDEFCGQVIFTSIDELNWDANTDSYKVIFIAGNEDFLQGSLHYTKACNAAKEKGVIVNTIYCGPREQGIRENWDLQAKCGSGSFTNINQNAKEEYIPTPYDSLLITMNGSLNSTYMWFGATAVTYQTKQISMDKANAAQSRKAEMARVKTKANKAAYKVAEADLVDAAEKRGGIDAEFINTNKASLPDSLKNKSAEEIKKVVEQKAQQRSAVQKEILELTAKRDAYIAEERKRRAAGKQENTLESEVEKMIKEQVKRYKMSIQ